MTTARRRMADAMMSTSGLCALVAGIWILSPDLRVQIANASGSELSSQVRVTIARAETYGYEFLGLVSGDQAADPLLVGFAIGAVVIHGRAQLQEFVAQNVKVAAALNRTGTMTRLDGLARAHQHAPVILEVLSHGLHAAQFVIGVA